MFIFRYESGIGIKYIQLSSIYSLLDYIPKLSMEKNGCTFPSINGVNSINICQNDITFQLSFLFQEPKMAMKVVREIASKCGISNYETIGFENTPSIVENKTSITIQGT